MTQLRLGTSTHTPLIPGKRRQPDRFLTGLLIGLGLSWALIGVGVWVAWPVVKELFT